MRNVFFRILIVVFSISAIGVKAQKSAKLEAYAEVPYAVGNIAYSYNHQLVFSNHPFFAPDIRVMTYNPSTKKALPFPSKEWNTRRKSDDHYLDDVLGIRNDSKGVVWMLDMGLKSGITPKLVGWNTKTNRLERIYYIPAPASIKTSQLNDFVIDEKRQIVVIADEDIGNGGDGSKGALVVLNMKTGVVKRVLEGHKTTIPENIPIVSDGKNLNIPGTAKPILVGADGITLDKNNEWLYYCPLNGNSVYRIRMDDLLTLDDSLLADKPERYASKHNNGGLSIDLQGNIYLTYVGERSIAVIPSGSNKPYIYATDSKLNWPDGVSYSNDGYMYTSAAQLTLAAVFNNGKDLTTKPFYIYRFKPLAKGIWGR